MAAPKFSEKFRRLCQAAAIADTGRTREVVHGLIAVSMIYGDPPWREADDWARAINSLFGLDVPSAEILSAVDQMKNPAVGTLIFDGRTGTYSLSPASRRDVEERISAGGALERKAQASWLADLDQILPDLPSKALWSCLLDYAGKALIRHGYEAVELIGGSSGSDADDDAPDSASSAAALLLESMRSNGIDAARYEDVASVVAAFFNGKNDDRVRYIAQLTDSVFNFLSINVDEDLRKTLLDGLPALTIFLDSNVIYGLIGAHSQPLAAASHDLLEAIRENDLPFKVYYHEKTLMELQRTIETVGRRLLRSQWTPAVSAGLLAAPRHLSSIEIKYHQQNSRTRTPPNVFLDRYSNIPGLLSDFGLAIYRAPETEEAGQLRHELVAEYEQFAKDNGSSARQQVKAYETLDHDMTIWLAASSRRRPRGRSPLFAGSLVLSADFLLRKFDRRVLAVNYGGGVPTIVMPDALFQALRPFMSSAQNFDSTFVEVFATPEFMGLNRSMNDARLNVAAYLATYEDLPEETATKLLTNAMLMNRVKYFDEDSSELRLAVDAALVEENETLMQERDQARSEYLAKSTATREAAVSMKQDLGELAKYFAGSDNDKALELLRSMESRISDLERQPNIVVKVNTGANMTDGDRYENHASQIAAQGRNASSSNTSQSMDARRIDVDASELARELDHLRTHLVNVAEQPEHYEAIANVVAARAAIEQSDEDGAVSKLKNAGMWALNAAREIGTDLAASVIAKSMGL